MSWDGWLDWIRHAALAAVVLSVAIGLFELTQDLVRARLMALSVMKATLVRAVAVLGLGAVVALVSPTGFLLLLSSALAYLLAVLVQSRTAWRGTKVKFDGTGLAGAGEDRPAAHPFAYPARDLQRHRSLHDRQSGRRRRRRQICRRARSGPADPDDAGHERRRGVLSDGGADSRQQGRRGGAIASVRLRRVAAQHHAAGLPRLCGHFRPCRQYHSRAGFPRDWRRRPCRSSR